MNNFRTTALFLGHANPANIPEENRYTRAWHQLGQKLPRPDAIVAISGHWFTSGIKVTAMAQPETLHDYKGFPPELYTIHYPAPGAPDLAGYLAEFLAPTPVEQVEQGWGFDYGCWGVLSRMYPDADIPIVQLSVDSRYPPAWHLAMGRRLAPLRNQNIMLVASGNVVHNLKTAQQQNNVPPFEWAQTFDNFVKDNLRWRGPDDMHPLVNYLSHPLGAQACPTPEHFLPLLYILGVWDGVEPITLPCEGMEMGSISMLAVQVG